MTNVERSRTGRLWGTAAGTIAAVGVAAVAGIGVWKSSHDHTGGGRPASTGSPELVLRPAPVQVESLGLVTVDVPILDGLVAPTPGAPEPTVYRPDPRFRQVTAVWLESPTTGCGQVSAIHVDEGADSVIVELTYVRQSLVCAANARMASVVIPLSRPLGSRSVDYPELPAG